MYISKSIEARSNLFRISKHVLRKALPGLIVGALLGGLAHIPAAIRSSWSVSGAECNPTQQWARFLSCQ